MAAFMKAHYLQLLCDYMASKNSPETAYETRSCFDDSRSDMGNLSEL